MDEQDRLAEVKALHFIGQISNADVDWLISEVESLRTELVAMKRDHDQEHHGLGVPGSDFAQYGGSYHDRDGNPL
jgi:hypothetical protein